MREAARRLAKIKCFRRQADQLAQTGAAQGSVTVLQFEKTVSYCLERDLVAELYGVSDRFRDQQMCQRKLWPFRKNMDKMLGRAEEDLKLYRQNAADVAQGKAQVDSRLIGRLRFAANNCDKDAFAKLFERYCLEHHLLLPQLKPSTGKIVETFGLCRDRQLSLSNFAFDDRLLCYQLNRLGVTDFDILENPRQPILLEANMRQLVLQRVQNKDIAALFPIERVDARLLNEEIIRAYAFRQGRDYDALHAFVAQHTGRLREQK